ncbi:MAG TPA: PVC-type heme-binding CxxCH protein, partial [Gemmataceae bacterium]|nr:PVC-type heme-binding CxxCH protein [Gemmataceae bacterium]
MTIPHLAPTLRRLPRLSRLAAAGLTLALLAAPGLSQNKPDPYAANIAPTDPQMPADEQKAFRLPPGFEIQLVAAEPDIHKPLNMAFDARGRLWVSETVEYPFPTKTEKGRDAIKILEDFGEDGRARKMTTFADGLHIPIGVLPLTVGARGESALSYSVPSVSRLTDTDGDGKADKREVYYATYGFADTHGMTNSFTWGFDGWVYACHGFSNTSTIKGADGRPITMQSGNTYRMRPDGSHLEQWTWGQVNPFGLCFDPLGNLYSCDCHTQPVYQLLRGAYYPSFGKPHDGLGFGPEAISFYPDSTAIAGIAYYAADYYPAPYRDAAYIGDVVTNRVNQFRLEWHGSSPRATKYDFLRCDDQWFRPVSVTLGPDGALYVADFYNRIIGHYEVPLTHPGRDRERGRIWRVVCRGADGKIKPLAPVADLTRAGVTELAAALGNPNLAVRTLATNQLVERGTKGAGAALTL